MNSRFDDGVWDIKVEAGALAYLCNDIQRLSGAGIVVPPGYDKNSQFETQRVTYYYIEEMVVDRRSKNNGSKNNVNGDDWGYIVLRLPENEVAKYLVVSMRDRKITFKNG